MTIDEKKLIAFLGEVRSCRDCKTVPCEVAAHCTPFVYGTPSSDILVISENPPVEPWREDIGRSWKQTLNVTKDGKGVQSKIARWLDVIETADRRFFWIQRANCFVIKDFGLAYKRCSRKFLHRAISLVNPKLIITLGGIAASYFFRFHSLKKLTKRCIDKEGCRAEVGGWEYEFVPFSHPSWRADKWRIDNSELHDGIVELAKIKISQAP